MSFKSASGDSQEVFRWYCAAASKRCGDGEGESSHRHAHAEYDSVRKGTISARHPC